jgi:uncharacterized protein (TIGR02271 family)
MAIQRANIREGMVVRSGDGEKLGKVVHCGPDLFIIEKGLFFPKDYECRYDDVTEVRGDEIFLRLLRDQLGLPLQERTGAGTTATGLGTGAAIPMGQHLTEETRIPLAEEQLIAEKRMQQVGEVRVTKDVITEEKQITVPVTKDVVTVERVPATEATPRPGQPLFREQTVAVPIHEEEVEISKRPVVREEVRITKDRVVEQRAATATTRREVADIDEEGTKKMPSLTDEDLNKRQT